MELDYKNLKIVKKQTTQWDTKIRFVMWSAEQQLSSFKNLKIEFQPPIF